MIEKKTIGRREMISLPDFGISEIEAKIDTGAYTSSLHCSEIIEEIHEGVQTLKVSLLDESHPEYSNQYFYFKEFAKKLVKSSNGESEERFIVTTQTRLFGSNHKARFSLTNRENMRYPVLLGRRFIKRHRFLVDVSLLHNAGKPL